MKLTLKDLDDKDEVFFDWQDSKAPTPGESYGRAEFIFCVIWRRGKIKEFYIYPAQQRDVAHYYRVKCSYSTQFSINAWMHKGLEHPKVWLSSWCQEHKCMNMRVYVPTNSTSFTICTLSTAGVNFDIKIPAAGNYPQKLPAETVIRTTKIRLKIKGIL